MRCRAALVAAPILGLACAPEPLLLEVPFATGAESALVVIEADGRSEIYAVDILKRNLQGLLAEKPGIDDDTPLRVTVASYTASLEALGLSAGRVTSAPLGSQLPEALEVNAAVIGRGPPVFAAADTLPSELSSFLLPTVCRVFSVGERWESTDPGFAPVGLALGPGGDVALMTVDKSSMIGSMLLIPGANGELLPVDSISEEMIHVYSARIAPEGTTWLAGGNFALGGLIARYESPAQLGYVLSGTQPMLIEEWPMAFVFADPIEGPEVVYAVLHSGALVRITGEQIERLTPGNGFGGSRPTLAIAGPDDVYYVPPSGMELHHYQGGMDVIETTDLDQLLREGRVRIYSVGVTRDGTAYAGTDLGPILKRGPDGHWDMYAREVVVGAEIWALEPFGDDGLLAANTYGKILQIYSPLAAPCEDTVNTGTNDVTQFIKVFPERQEIWVAGNRSDPQAGKRYPYLARIRVP